MCVHVYYLGLDYHFYRKEIYYTTADKNITRVNITQTEVTSDIILSTQGGMLLNIVTAHVIQHVLHVHVHECMHTVVVMLEHVYSDALVCILIISFVPEEDQVT